MKGSHLLLQFSKQFDGAFFCLLVTDMQAFCRTECLVWLLVCQCYGIQQLCERAAEVKPHKIGFLFIFIFYHRCRLSQNYFYVRSSLMRYTWNGDMEHIRRIYNMPAFTPVSQNRVQIAFCLNEILNEARRGELERLHASGRSELQSVRCHTYRFL